MDTNQLYYWEVEQQEQVIPQEKIKRKILDESEIEKNIKNIQNILKKFLDNDDLKTKPIYVNNYTWLKDLNYISFLRDI